MAITRKSVIKELTGASQEVLDAGAGTDTIVSILCGNISGLAHTVDVFLDKGAGSKQIVKELTVDVNSVVEVLVGGNAGLFLEAGNKLYANADATDAVNMTVSYLHEE